MENRETPRKVTMNPDNFGSNKTGRALSDMLNNHGDNRLTISIRNLFAKFDQDVKLIIHSNIYMGTRQHYEVRQRMLGMVNQQYKGTLNAWPDQKLYSALITPKIQSYALSVLKIKFTDALNRMLKKQVNFKKGLKQK